MDKYLQIWEPVLRSFVRQFEAEFYNQNARQGYFCEEDDKPEYEIVDWYPSGYMEITVTMKDGRQFVYDFTNDRIYQLRNNKQIRVTDEQSWRENFSRRLRISMKRRGISQDRLSDLTGISKATISKYMNGIASPSSYNLERICRALECSLNEIASVY